MVCEIKRWQSLEKDQSPARIYLGRVSLTAPSIDFTTVDACNFMISRKKIDKILGLPGNQPF